MTKKLISTQYHSHLLAKLIIIGTLILFSGCFGMKNSSVNSGKNLFETFFVGDDGIQYYVKPLLFTDVNKNRMMLDLTFRYKDTVKDSATVNISFMNTEIIRDIDSLIISNNLISVQYKQFKYLFSERMRSDFNSRYSTKCPLVDLYKLFDQNNWILTVYSKGVRSEYGTPQNTMKKIDKLKYEIFTLF
jgi:hypothetical protein